MTVAYYPNDSRYYAELYGWRDGFTIYGQLVVRKTGGYSYHLDADMAYGANIAGQSADGAWAYDFRSTDVQNVWTWSRTVSAPGTYNVDGWADMEGKGRAQPGTIWITVPPNAPSAPSSLTVARSSDTQQNCSWTRNASTPAPYSGQQVLRNTHAGSWSGNVAIASFGYSNTTGAEAFYDTTTIPNRVYQYQIKSYNDAGEAYSAVSALVFTTPAAPVAVTATKLSNTSIQLDLSQGVLHGSYKTTIEYSLNGSGTWTALTTLNAGVLTYLWSSVPAGSSVQFRARVYVDYAGAVGNGLTSANTLSSVVPLASPPNAPSALAPNGLVFDAATAQLFTWQHNTVDSSPQSYYELRYKKTTDSTWITTGKITSGTSSRNITAGTFSNGFNYEWQVRTWGIHADPSAYSSSATFYTSTPPTVTITQPVSPLAAALATAVWTYYDAEGSAQSAWEALLIRAGSTLESLSGSGATNTVDFATRLTDATTYQVHVRVRDGSGLWSAWDQRSFTTNFPVPATPTITAVWDKEIGATKVVVTNPSGSVVVTHNDIYSSSDNGQTWELVDTAPLNGTGFDRTMVLGQWVLYKAIAWSALPSSTESAQVSVNSTYVGEDYIGPDGGYWSGGAGFNTILRMKHGYQKPQSIEMTTGAHEKVLHYYAGRDSAVETMGEATVRTGKVEFLVLTLEDMRKARQLATMPAPHLFRLPDGTKVFASIGAVTDTRLQEGAYTISLQITEVDR